jgi:hypothetical protein
LGSKFVGNPYVKIAKVDCTLDSSKELCNQQEVTLLDNEFKFCLFALQFFVVLQVPSCQAFSTLPVQV